MTKIGSHLYAFDSNIYSGTIANAGFNTGYSTNGADIWKWTGPATAVNWTRVTGDGFGDTSIIQFEAFTTFNSALHVAGSNITSSGFNGEQAPGYSGAKIFRLVAGLPDDRDEDGILDGQDNCPTVPNGTSVGTCSSGYTGVSCTTNGDCGVDGFCSLNQEDTDTDGTGDVCDNCPDLFNVTQDDNYPPGGNNCGDACECEGNFDGDDDVDGTDSYTFGTDFGRNQWLAPCTPENRCNGDFDCDGDVDAADVIEFRDDFGRSGYSDPCPLGAEGDWCSY